MSRQGKGPRPVAAKPRRPYRDSAILYAGLATIVVVIAAVTGGNVVRAFIAAAVCFAAAMAWTWWRFRARAQRESGQ